VVALHAGYGQQELVSVALPEGKVIARVVLGDAFYGLALDGLCQSVNECSRMEEKR
jgi:hypothetical protein